ncbi:Rieske (2Fe-2S) protein [Nocardioides marmotae]|uniref:Rieske (2Fe-2S) protein n=1 Tax=Nocardioides marmotae TaxID=2663857 RepID=UPI0012B59326|nr:Rieske (2Fe-2S) protein [Nocardioides marmotae]MBC9733639.1 Rieske (2Fe-2S) protein [Nocardioides marmotae]MTB84742.1 Rieske 2Fe-2S domain-containing protein [Nocardioides marmotae]
MSDDTRSSVPLAELAGGKVRLVGQWVVGLRRTTDAADPTARTGEPFAVSRRCRHQLADLSKGHVDEDGCLVCPWHQSRYDVSTGAMVDGPRGFLGYHGPARGYRQFVAAYAKVLKLRTGRARVVDDRVEVG